MPSTFNVDTFRAFDAWTRRGWLDPGPIVQVSSHDKGASRVFVPTSEEATASDGDSDYSREESVVLIVLSPEDGIEVYQDALSSCRGPNFYSRTVRSWTNDALDELTGEVVKRVEVKLGGDQELLKPILLKNRKKVAFAPDVDLVLPTEDDNLVQTVEKLLEGDPVNEWVNKLVSNLDVPREVLVGLDVSREQSRIFAEAEMKRQEEVLQELRLSPWQLEVYKKSAKVLDPFPKRSPFSMAIDLRWDFTTTGRLPSSRPNLQTVSSYSEADAVYSQLYNQFLDEEEYGMDAEQGEHEYDSLERRRFSREVGHAGPKAESSD